MIDIQKLHDDGKHAIEMTSPILPLQLFAKRRFLQPVTIAIRIERFLGWTKRRLNSRGLQLVDVLLKWPGIP